ncbi:cyclin-like protein [Viridothelium virens]|uniref:RNA polymerase II holoenzyme cyclin-like subunit n=1 Tax=Viridothelium virens TaxID=1048519 RepID=A0A6A6H0C6_VIRVR|nr:cyclin-like protein [Viridothelium virens]
MAPPVAETESSEVKGPHPSFIEVAKPYIFEQELQESLAALGVSEQREDQMRLQGVAWIDRVRKALSLPVRTYNTACVYYHKFRLMHADNEYNYIDAAAAALFTACKIEDTLKKSKEILCTAYNMNVGPADKLSPDDPIFETGHRTLVGLERLMLECSSFDFRNRFPQELLIKLCKACKYPAEPVSKCSFNICNDLYRTFAPLKQTSSTMALASLELAARLHTADLHPVRHHVSYTDWATTRAEVMETLLDLLDLYTHHRNQTIEGPKFAIEAFIAIRITLNNEAAADALPRHTETDEVALAKMRRDAAAAAAAASSSANFTNGKNGSGAAGGGTGAGTSSGKPSPQSPLDAPGSAASGAAAAQTTPVSPPEVGMRGRGGGERGRDGTVRFMLDVGRSKEEKGKVAEYFEEEWEEVEEEFEVEDEDEGA